MENTQKKIRKECKPNTKKIKKTIREKRKKRRNEQKEQKHPESNERASSEYIITLSVNGLTFQSHDIDWLSS